MPLFSFISHSMIFSVQAVGSYFVNAAYFKCPAIYQELSVSMESSYTKKNPFSEFLWAVYPPTRPNRNSISCSQENIYIYKRYLETFYLASASIQYVPQQSIYDTLMYLRNRNPKKEGGNVFQEKEIGRHLEGKESRGDHSKRFFLEL